MPEKARKPTAKRKAKGPAISKAKKDRPELPAVSKSNIDKIESETINRVNRTLSALEVAISEWEASKEKPEELKEKYMRYKWLHEALTRWEKKMLMSLGKAEAYAERMGRLQEFAGICNSYSSR